MGVGEEKGGGTEWGGGGSGGDSVKARQNIILFYDCTSLAELWVLYLLYFFFLFLPK